MAQNSLKQFSNKTNLNNLFEKASQTFHHGSSVNKFSSLPKTKQKIVPEGGKPFSEIPGPTPLPLIGNIWRYLPIIGEYRLDSMEGNGKLNLARYGKIVREEITAEHVVLHLFDPAHMAEMFRQEDRYPYRRSHRALLKFRRERPHLYASGGIFPENGPEWARLRDIFKRHFLLAQNINPYDSLLNDIADDTIDLLRSTRDNKTCVIADLQNEMYKWSLESICGILLDARIGCLKSTLDPDSDASRLIAAGNNTIEMVAQTELYAGWEENPNRAYRSLEKSQDDMSEIVYKHFCNKLKHMGGNMSDHSSTIQSQTNNQNTAEAVIDKQNNRATDQKENCIKSRQTLLEKFISNGDIDRKDVFGMLVDSVMAGIDTTSITASFVCYFLSENPKYQSTLRNEIQDVLRKHSVRALKGKHLHFLLFFSIFSFVKIKTNKPCLEEEKKQSCLQATASTDSFEF